LAVIGRALKSPHGEVWIKMISWLYWIFFVTAGQRHLELPGVIHGAM
jgi:hypothetical protein